MALRSTIFIASESVVSSASAVDEAARVLGSVVGFVVVDAVAPVPVLDIKQV